MIVPSLRKRIALFPSYAFTLTIVSTLTITTLKIPCATVRKKKAMNSVTLVDSIHVRKQDIKHTEGNGYFIFL